MASYRSGLSHLSSLLDESSDVGTLHASAQVMTAGLLTLHHASLTKVGDALTGSADVRDSDLTAAAAGLVHGVTPIASSNGQLVFRFTVPVFGQIDGVVQAVDGKILAAPDVPLVGSAFTFTLFDDPHVAVDSVSAHSSPGGFAISARGHLN